MSGASSADILKASFPKFLWYVWTKVLNLPRPTRVQLDIAQFLTDGPERRFIQAFRGVGKTFLTAAFVVWRLWKNPQLKVLVVSANEKHATEVATFIKLIIDADPLWVELRPQAHQRSSALAFDVGPAIPDKSPSVKAVGIFGQLTGSRADLLISDDVEVPKNAETEGMREKLKERVAEYAAILKPGGEVLYLGTPQTQESIYRDLPAKGYLTRIWPARYPTPEKLAVYGDLLAPMLLADLEADPTLMRSAATDTGGAPTDPDRFSDLDLLKREIEYRRAGFLLQYQLDTSLSDADKFPLKTGDLIVADVDKKIAPVRLAWGSSPEQVLKDLANVGFDGDRFYRPMYSSPEFTEFTGSVMFIDPSGRGKDETAYCVTKFLNGMVFVRRWGGFTEGYTPETLSKLAEIAASEEVATILCEDNMGDGMFRRLLEPVVARRRPTRIEGYTVTGQKEKRILASLEPVLGQHRLVMDTSVVKADLAHPDMSRRGLYQLTHLTGQRGSLKHDDRLDVLAAAVRHWANQLNADSIKAEEEFQRRANEAFEREFFKGTIVGAAQAAPREARRGTGRVSRRPLRRGSW